ncbi:MAG: hypothetical protein ACFCU5_11885 [Pleurocapsa sp.]
MHDRSNSPSAEIELFPFLSVLFCTIGTLILIIILLVVQASASNKKVNIIAKNDSSINQNKTPRYIECQSDGVIIHPTEEFISIEDINQTNSIFDTFLSEIKAQETEYLIIAIRPDGVEIFQEIRELIESEGIDIGYEPIDQDWELKIKQK